MTLSKLAKLANVSVSTASKAFAMRGEISPETRERVFAVAKEQGVFRQFYNAKYYKPVIAVICPETVSRFYSEILDTLRVTLESHKCEMCISATEFSNEKACELLEYFDRYASVDGVILLGIMTDVPPEITIPVINLLYHNDRTPSITIDLSSIYEKILKDHKTDSVCFIGEAKTTTIRYHVEEALIKNGIKYDKTDFYITHKRFEKGGYTAMTQLINDGKSPDLLICAYDYMAIGAIRALADNGKACPKIIGFNNIPECDYTVPRISSIGYNARQLCETAATTITDLINGKTVNSVCFELQYFDRK